MIFKWSWVSDLHWTLCSSPLLSPQALGSFQPDPLPSGLLEWLHDIDINAPSNHPLKDDYQRLGIYFEQLWKFFLENHPDYELLFYNTQVRENKRTIGAFDFIYRNIKTNKTVHLETAVKFYLSNQVHSDPMDHSNWLGPLCKDRLDIKFNKLSHSQIGLSTTSAGLNFLEHEGLKVDKHEIQLKGCLFYPFNETAQAPTGYHPQHQRGLWLELKSLPQLKSNQDNWFIVSKMQWLSHPGDIETASLETLKLEIETLIHLYQVPLMIVQQNETIHRYFITPNNWPN